VDPSLCSGVVDAVLIPEIPFTLKGPNGLFQYLDGVLKSKGHCVVCVAEGAGQVGATCGDYWIGMRFIEYLAALECK